MIFKARTSVCVLHNSTHNARILRDIRFKFPNGSKYTVEELISYSWKQIGPTEVMWWKE